MNFSNWWQSLPSKMDPILLQIGPLSIYWYSTMYLVAFLVVFLLGKQQIQNNKFRLLNLNQFEDLLTWCFIGVLLGGRLGYVFFYNFDYYFSNPLEILIPFANQNGQWVFTGIAGMSYHGGVLGVVVAIYLYAKKMNLHLFQLADFLTPLIPLGYFFGRIGNFINGELYGRVTEASIGMIFPNSGSFLLRHPSQLYEAFFEGIILYFIIKNLQNSSFLGWNSGLYVFGYGFFRFFIEFFREPDSHLGFILLNLSMGQLLCILMMISAVSIWLIGKKIILKD